MAIKQWLQNLTKSNGDNFKNTKVAFVRVRKKCYSS